MDRDETIKADGTCEGTKDDGTRCRASAIGGSHYCFFHDPTMEDARKTAQQRGGRANRSAVLPDYTADVPLDSPKDVAVLLAETINQVRKGQIGPKPAGTIGYLASALTRVLEPAKTDERLARLERALGARVEESPEFDVDDDFEAIGDDDSKPKKTGRL
jgi:alkylhydroperoxidase family enzyme